MFLDNLGASLKRLCEARGLSYVSAAELCGISAGFFGNIVRGTSVPTVTTLEKICKGFNVLPDELLTPPTELSSEAQFRTPMKVSEIHCYYGKTDINSFPICPRCSRAIMVEYQYYCDNCGQCLDWKDLAKATVIPPVEI